MRVSVDTKSAKRGDSDDVYNFKFERQKVLSDDAFKFERQKLSSGHQRYDAMLKQILTPSGRAFDRTDYDVNIRFSFVTFAKELFYNLCWPFSIPFALRNEGIIGAKNREFIPSPGYVPHFMFGMANFGNVQMLVGTSLFLSYYVSVEQTGQLSPFELFLFNGALILRFIAIAIKYAYFPQKDTHRMNTELMKFAELQKMQIIFGWTPIPDCVLNRALRQAEKRRKLELSQIFFVQNSDDPVSAKELLFALWRASTDTTHKTVGRRFALIAMFGFCTAISGCASRDPNQVCVCF